MNQLKIFEYKNNKIRTEIINNDPFFCVQDVCKVLEIANGRNVIARMNAKDVVTMDTLTNGGKQKMSFVSEAGLYQIVFESRKPEAEAFKHWVTHEVLPSIRKTGSYSIAQQFKLPANYIEALEELVIKEKERIKLEIENQVLTPKAKSYDNYLNTNGFTDIAEAAKTIFDGSELGRNQLFGWLRDKGVIYKESTAVKQAYVNSGILKVIPVKNKHLGTYYKPYFTKKGMDWLIKNKEDVLKWRIKAEIKFLTENEVF